jgi:hypothetical protein
MWNISFSISMHRIIQSDSKLLSGLPCIGHGNPDNNSETLNISREKEGWHVEGLKLLKLGCNRDKLLRIQEYKLKSTLDCTMIS